MCYICCLRIYFCCLQVQAYLYDGYWEDIGTIEAFYNANLGITKKPVPDFRYAFNFYTLLWLKIMEFEACEFIIVSLWYKIYHQNICSFYDRSAPIYTQPRHLPPSKVLDADVTDSVIGEGCVIKVSMLCLYVIIQNLL